jgi:CRISPR/Cas system-associated protein Cas10 (large subunit of type III CRISPR-Cas system)
LATTHPDIAAQWHPTMNGELLPTQVSKGYKYKVWFLCPVCNNPYDSLISNKINGYGKCPYCSPRKTRARKVLQVETGVTFKTLKEAAKSIGKEDYRQIWMCCKGKCKTAYGFHWKYTE